MRQLQATTHPALPVCDKKSLHEDTAVFAARFDFEVIDVFEIVTPLYTHPEKREIRKFRRSFEILVLERPLVYSTIQCSTIDL